MPTKSDTVILPSDHDDVTTALDAFQCTPVFLDRDLHDAFYEVPPLCTCCIASLLLSCHEILSVGVVFGVLFLAHRLCMRESLLASTVVVSLLAARCSGLTWCVCGACRSLCACVNQGYCKGTLWGVFHNAINVYGKLPTLWWNRSDQEKVRQRGSLSCSTPNPCATVMCVASMAISACLVVVVVVVSADAGAHVGAHADADAASDGRRTRR